MRLFGISSALLVLFVVSVFHQEPTESVSIKGLLSFSLVPDLLKLLTNLTKFFEALLKQSNGVYLINQTLVFDLISSCEELRIIERDYSMFSSTGLCPNITDVMVDIAAAAKMTLDPMMELASLGLSLYDDSTDCRNKKGFGRVVCYIGVATPLVKDVKILIHGVQQYIDEIHFMTESIHEEIDYCNRVYNSLPAAQKEAVKKQWLDDINSNNTTCIERVKHLLNVRAKGSNTTRPPGDTTTKAPGDVNTTTLPTTPAPTTRKRRFHINFKRFHG